VSDAPTSARFTEVDVQRINVREPDGTLRMTLSGRALAPDPVVKSTLGQRQGGNAAGIIFYNDEGDECGGLIYGSHRTADGHYSAEASLTFDRYQQDQVVQVHMSEADGHLSTRLRMWERPSVPLHELRERYAALGAMPHGAARDAATEALRGEGLLGTERLSVGVERDGSALIGFYDRAQRERLRIVLGGDGAARIEFLDEQGEVVRRIGPEPG
jgi:hypothetical protein